MKKNGILKHINWQTSTIKSGFPLREKSSRSKGNMQMNWMARKGLSAIISP